MEISNNMFRWHRQALSRLPQEGVRMDGRRLCVAGCVVARGRMR